MKFTIYLYQQRIEINLLLFFLKQYTVTIERNSSSLVRKLMRKNKLGVSRCDKELRRDFNAFPVLDITKEGEKYRSKGKSFASNECVLAVFLFENFFWEKFAEGTSLNTVLLGPDKLSTRDRFQKYGIKKLTGVNNFCCLISAMKGRHVTSTRFPGSHYEIGRIFLKSGP